MKQTKLSFQLKPREEVLEVVHESVIPHLPRFLFLVFWFLLPFFFLFVLFEEGMLGMSAFFVAFFVTLFFLWKALFRWGNTVLVVTDVRVVDIDQKGFFDRTVTEATYKQIDEVNYRVKGFIPTIFRYGTVRLHLSGTAADIEFRNIVRPARIHDLINDLREEHGQK